MKPKIKRKIMWEKKGVSEVVGTILMLAITVVMFSSIMVWVGKFPTPQTKSYVEISGTVTPADADNWTVGAWVNLTHSGGVGLVEYWTDILVDVDGVRTGLSFSDSLIPLGEEWEAGETFSYFIPAGSITETSSVSGMIVDRDKDSIVWNGELRGGSSTFGPIIRNVWIDSDLATVVEEPGPVGFETDEFRIFAKVIDPEANDPEHGLNVSSVWCNLSSIGRGVIRLEDDDFDNIFTNTSMGANISHSPGYYHMRVNATDMDGKMDNYTMWFSVGGDFSQSPQIAIYANNETSTSIWTEPANPQNGQQVRLYVTVRNLGGSGAHISVKFYDQNASGTFLINEKADVGMGIGEQDVWIPWTARPGGIHNITVWAFINNNSANYGLTDSYPNDDMNSTDITVFPTILLVDDDQNPNNRGLGDTANFMMAALDASDFDYDFTVVNTGGNGPGYDYGDFKMLEYDIVVWMTGYEESSTLTVTDIGELEKFMDGGGSLWMIGHGIFAEAALAPAGQLANFINTYLNTSGITPITTGSEEVNGIQNHNVTDYFYGNMLNLTERVAGENHAYELDNSGAYTDTAFIGNTTLQPYAVSNVNSALDKKTFVQSFEFSMIDNTADQAQLAFLVITWLADIDARFGRDLAVSEQIMEPAVIYYKQEVSITGVIRNNAINYTEQAVEWRLTIVSPSGSTRIIVNSTDQLSTDPEFVSVGTGRNNSVAVTLHWIPEEIGPHSIVFEVDPNDRIDETNEDNNRLSDLLVSDEVNVNYRILVVDDDEVVGGVNETAQVTGALDDLGYVYETFVVQNGNPGPIQENLTNYNAVLWVGGDVDNPLTSGAGMDEERIEYYLDHGGNFWLIGANCLGDSLSFYEDSLFKINSLTTSTGMPAVLNGINIPDGTTDYWDYFTHGMAYDTVGGAAADTITPWPAAGEPIFYQDDAHTQYNSIRYEDAATQYKTVVSTFSMDYLADNESKAEFVFMLLKWFEMPDERAEARITVPDIWISNDHPQLGDSYIIQATVYNPGGGDANVLVRFMDGTTQIGSDSISVSANSRTTAEMVWTPLFAGQRNITIFVDPIQEQPEIFEWSNNNATVSLYVYFFWDDMETDASRWSHESTIMLINGESALDYFSDTTLYTNITTDWDDTLSSYVAECTDEGFYHTYDRSAWLQEPYAINGTVASRTPVDVVFALDTSGSMHWDAGGNWVGLTNPTCRWYNARVATIGFVENLTDVDRAVVFTFDDSADFSPLIAAQYEYMTDVNKQAIIDALNAFNNVQGGTPFYDTVGKSIQFVVDNVLDPDPNPDLLSQSRNEYVIGVGDGHDTRSDEWTPTADWGTTTGGDKGYLNAPPMIYTIGVVGIDHDPAYPVAPNWSRTAPDILGPNPNYWDEYYMWHPSDSSPLILNDAGGKYGENKTTGDDNVGHYYFAQDPADLPGIFQAIFQDIQTVVVPPENVTRAGDMVLTRGDTGGEGLNALPTPPSPSGVSVYNYVGVDRTTNDHYAYFCDVDNSNSGELTNPNSRNEFSSNPQYADVQASNNNRANSNDPGNGDEIFTESRFQIAETPTDIISIALTMEIQGDRATAFRTYAYNVATSTWDQIGAQSPLISADTDWVITNYITANCDNYIDGTGMLRWGVYQTDSSDDVRVDYIEAVVSWSAGGGGGTIAPTVLAGFPTDGSTDVPIDQDVIIVFSEDMNTGTVSYSITPNPGGLTNTWSGGDTLLTISHTNFAYSTSYTVQVTAGDDQNEGETLTNIPYSFSFTTAADTGPVVSDPYIVYTYPPDTETDVPIGADISVIFSEPMNTGTVTYTVNPNPGGLAVSWDAADTVMTISHNDYAYSTGYDVEVTAGQDKDGNPLATVTPGGTETTRVNQDNDDAEEWVANGNMYRDSSDLELISDGGDQEVGMRFRNINIPNGATITDAYIEFECDEADSGATSLVFWGEDVDDASGFGGGDYDISNRPKTTANVAWNNVPPWTVNNQYQTPDLSSIIQEIIDRGGWVGGNDIVIIVTGSGERTAESHDGEPNAAPLLVIEWGTGPAGAAPNPWSFTTEAQPSTGGGNTTIIIGNGTGNPGVAPPGENFNKSAVTGSFDLRNVKTSTLSFWHKYNIVSGVNGGVLMVGFRESAGGPFKFRYVVPSSAYTGNMRLTDTNRTDDMGVWMRWAWNGVSGGGTFGWEKVSLDILPYINKTGAGGYDPLSEVKVKFAYYQYGAGTGYGWYIDDVRVTVSRSDYSNPDINTADIWNRTTADSHSGDYSWSNVDPITGEMKAGIDNYLMTSPIDLTNARTATLSAYFKFNINTADGAPPDGFRVEISKDNGVSWEAINLGVRAAWGISGTGADADDGNISDGKTYTGLDPDGDHWVEAGTLTRLNCDLSSFSGNAIMIRFRVVTTNHPLYDHDDNAASGDPGFGGFWVDDVIVSGNTILG